MSPPMRAPPQRPVARPGYPAATSAPLADITNIVGSRGGSVNGQQHGPREKPKQAQVHPQSQQQQQQPLQQAQLKHDAAARTAGGEEVQDYVEAIYGKLFTDEVLYLPRPNYMETQRDLNANMRAILVDWIVEVHTEYRLRVETLFLAVSLVDRHLARLPVTRGQLQLVGVAAMFVAAKFEELRPPDVTDFVYITDNAYRKEDILMMECTLLTTLGFHIASPTAAHFLQLLHHACGCSEQQRQLSHYVAQLALVELDMLRHAPSRLAAAALLLSNEVLGRRPAWPAVLARESRHGEQSLRGCAGELRQLLRGSPSTKLQAVRKKFSLPLFQSVATLSAVRAA